MMTLNEITHSDLEKARKLEHRGREKRYKQARHEKALRDALTFRVGELVLECWPWVAHLKVRKTMDENTAEFAPLRKVLMRIASDPNYTTILHSLSTSHREDV